MKHKFSSMGRVAIALVLALSLSLVMAVPVMAAAVGTPTVTLDSYLAGKADVEHTISFDIGVSLAVSEEIIITFDGAYAALPDPWADGDITVDGESILGTKVATADKVVTITLRTLIDTDDNPVVVVFTSAAGIDNPTAESYTLKVKTTVETVATSTEYTLYDAPIVTALEPNKGNMGDTMWVEVTGDKFAGNVDTNASVTTLDFGTGIDVVSTKYIGVGEIDCQITINATGTPLVVGTTAAVTGTDGITFTANLKDTAQVDVWSAYVPATDIFVGATLAFRATYDTITLAVDAGSTVDDDTLIVHADTYDATAGETFPITIADDITLQSLSGAALTTIDVSSVQDTTDAGTRAASIGIAVTDTGVTITGFTIIGVPTVTDSTATGFTYSSGDYPTIKATADGLTVQNCIFNAPSSEVGHEALLAVTAASTGVEFLDNEVNNYIYGVTAKVDVDKLLVDGNTFNQTSYLEDPDGWPGGVGVVPIYLCKGVQFQSGERSGTGLTVTDNTFTGPATLEGEFDTGALKDIFAIYDSSSNGSAPDITGNTISNYFAGIFTWAGGTISDNNIDACTVGITVGQRRSDSPGVLGKALTISENDITDSLNRGIWVQDGSETVTVKYNTIAGNANYGLTNEIVSGTATAGSTSTLTDTSLDWDLGYGDKVGFIARGVLAGDRVVNVTTGLTATVNGAATAYQLALTADDPDAGFTFSAGDSYRIEADVDVDSAKYNWWGHIGGPSADAGVTAPLGSGDVLSSQMKTGLTDTVYDPWLTEPQATVIADGVRSYGSDAITLAIGWNTLSVPCGLKSTANTFGEIIDLGTYLVWEGTAQNYVGGYWYDASLEDPQWKGIDNSTTLEPGKGFYVKMSSATSFPVLYFDGNVSLPAYDMYAGWNLIGSAFGIDKVGASTWAVGASETGANDGADNNTTLMVDNSAAFTVNELVGLTIVNVTNGSSGVITANTATTVTVIELIGGTEQDWDGNDVYSIAYTKAKMGIGAALISIDIPGSVVISPSVPGQAAGWAAAVDDTGTYRMYVGEAYWVFMDANGTLAGFEVTPFCFTPGAMP